MSSPKDKITALKERIHRNYSEYGDNIVKFDTPQMLDKSKELACTNDMYAYMTERHEYSEPELDYLLLFQDPLRVAVNAWLDSGNSEVAYGFYHAVDARRAILEDCELAGDTEQTIIVQAQTEDRRYGPASINMSDEDFISSMNTLLPGADSEAIQNLVTYGGELEADETYAKSEYLAETFVEFVLVTRHYEPEIARQLVELCKTFTPNAFEVRGIANLLRDGEKPENIENLVYEGMTDRVENEDAQTVAARHAFKNGTLEYTALPQTAGISPTAAIAEQANSPAPQAFNIGNETSRDETPEKPYLRVHIANTEDIVSGFSGPERSRHGEYPGVWLNFPIIKEDFKVAVAEIGANGAEYFISGYETNIKGLIEHLPMSADIDVINHLAYRLLEEIHPQRLPIFEAVMQSGRHCGSLRDIINVTENLDCFNIRPIHSLEQYAGLLRDNMRGQYAEALTIVRSGTAKWMRDISAYIAGLETHFDAEAYATAVVADENGQFLPCGYLTESGGFVEVYNSKYDIERRCLVSDSPEPPQRTHTPISDKPQTLAEQLRAAKEQAKTQDTHKNSKSRDKREER